mmetsp:Transcript_14250/g.22195  ORF Transcript_14250/g.22195 Transcript_14250/m.22195 type:complete len:122 (-) Transcript_14250:691-1056(-)
MIKALEIIAEGEQEAMVKESDDKDSSFKSQELGHKGLPSEEDESREGKDPEKEAKKKEIMELGKPGKGMGQDILKIGGKVSPKNGKERDHLTKFASHLRPATQLNTIEEDLHETQTSHNSY